MPCMGPTPEEERLMEEANCEKLYGVRDTELNIATRVACLLADGISNDLTRRWVAEHKRRDNIREAREREAKKEAQIKEELADAERRIRRKYK